MNVQLINNQFKSYSKSKKNLNDSIPNNRIKDFDKIQAIHLMEALCYQFNFILIELFGLIFTQKTHLFSITFMFEEHDTKDQV